MWRSRLRRLFDRQFDELAAATHGNLVVRAAAGVIAGGLAAFVLPLTICAAWIAALLGTEIWGWFASRAQFLGRTVNRRRQLNYLASLCAMVSAWFALTTLYWWNGSTAGGLTALVILVSVIGFGQTFASRSPLGFTVCGVVPGLGMLALIQFGPHHDSLLRAPVLGTLALAIGFAVFGARQTLGASRKLTRTQDQLKESESRYRVLADNITDVILLRSLDAQWRYVSPSVHASLGYTPEEFADLDPKDYVHPDDRLLLREKFQALVQSGGTLTFEHRLIRRDRSICWMETSYILLTDPDSGKPMGVVSTSRNIDHRKAMEDDLIQARVTAETAAAAKSDFLANMTHELRTPLNAIVGFSGILKGSQKLDDQDARHAKLINAASSTLLGVVNGILDFSKLESGAFAFDPKPFDPADMAGAVAMMIEDQARARGLSLKVVTPEAGLPWLDGDAPRLQQVLLNLLGNAMKFTPTGGVEVRLETQPCRDGRQRLCVAVVDTGIGVAEDKLSAIFERFSQADASVSRTFGGTGLGLAISKRIVELMGGEIGVTSVVGEGSTFWFEVPLPVATPTGQAEAEDGVATDLERPLRVLLAEDNAVNRELVQAFLGPFDIALDMAVNGREAVEMAVAGRYDIILMDVQMPIMDGMTATQRIRAHPDPAICGAPIIAMTANVLPEQVQKCLDAGMSAHLGKPLDPRLLIEALLAWTSAPEAVPDLEAQDDIAQARSPSRRVA